MVSPPSAEATLHPDFRGPAERPGWACSRRGMIFDSAPLECAPAGDCGPLARQLLSAAATWPRHSAEAVKRKSAEPARPSSCIRLRTQAGPSLDHLVGVEQERPRDRQAERLGGLEIDHQLE